MKSTKLKLLAMMIGLSMAEIVSAIPTSGGPYFWSAILAPKGHAPFASWITGWYACVSQIATHSRVEILTEGL